MTPEQQARRRSLAVGWMAVIGTFVVGACCGSATTFSMFIGPLLTR